mmetsp:Transcript_4104/g.17211  ORF Transcript_4104/g.17211 Transcript_4104/m.17211 type:complete len:231 (-) Transcript_4104:3392-4084(-)
MPPRGWPRRRRSRQEGPQHRRQRQRQRRRLRQRCTRLLRGRAPRRDLRCRWRRCLAAPRPGHLHQRNLQPSCRPIPAPGTAAAAPADSRMARPRPPARQHPGARETRKLARAGCPGGRRRPGNWPMVLPAVARAGMRPQAALGARRGRGQCPPPPLLKTALLGATEAGTMAAAATTTPTTTAVTTPSSPRPATATSTTRRGDWPTLWLALSTVTRRRRAPSWRATPCPAS